MNNNKHFFLFISIKSVLWNKVFTPSLKKVYSNTFKEDKSDQRILRYKII